MQIRRKEANVITNHSLDGIEAECPEISGRCFIVFLALRSTSEAIQLKSKRAITKECGTRTLGESTNQFSDVFDVFFSPIIALVSPREIICSNFRQSSYFYVFFCLISYKIIC